MSLILDAHEPAPTDASVPRNKRGKPEGVVIDTGTGKRIPFVRWCDLETGEYEAIRATADGQDYALTEDARLSIIRDKAVGKLKIVSTKEAALLGHKPKPVVSPITPVTKEQKLEGLRQYKEMAFVPVRRWRGESRRSAEQSFERVLAEYKDEDFGADLFDFMLLRRTTVSTSTT